MVLGETSLPRLTMAMAVRTLQVFRGLVLAYGMATLAFVVRVGADVKGYYWVTANNESRVEEGGGVVSLVAG